MMYIRFFVIAALISMVDSFVSVRNTGTKFALRMDVEGPSSVNGYPAFLSSVGSKFIDEKVSFDRLITKEPVLSSIEEAEFANGMPWQTSIKADKDNCPPLTYMPFWEWQMSFMKSNLSNLHALPCTSRESPSYRKSTLDFSYNENVKKGARIVNLNFASDEYRKIRMTYYDAGEGCQVYNSLWYPREGSNLPLLGIDLLAFNGKKFLAIVDFQPIHEDEEDHAQLYEQSVMAPIRDKFPSLQGQMSAKFYDETQFFSRQMIFSRFEEKGIIMDDLFPAFQEYVSAHVNMVQETEVKDSNIGVVKERISAYDSYSAERDPATGLFASMFGQQWADEYVHGFLFSQSAREENEYSMPTRQQSSHQHQSKPTTLAPSPVMVGSR